MRVASWVDEHQRAVLSVRVVSSAIPSERLGNPRIERPRARVVRLVPVEPNRAAHQIDIGPREAMASPSRMPSRVGKPHRSRKQNGTSPHSSSRRSSSGYSCASALFANYIAEAFREPLKARRTMLEHAAAGVMNVDLVLGELVQIWRVIRELEPADVLSLYAAWLVPSREVNRIRPDAVRAKVLGPHGADTLLSCGALRVREQPGVIATDSNMRNDGPQFNPVYVTRRGELILSGLRTYLLAHARNFDIPGHEQAPGARAEAEARELLEALPYVNVLRSYQNKLFKYGCLTYDAPNVAGGMPHDGRAQLVFRDVLADHVAALPYPEERKVQLGEPVEDIWVDSVGKHANLDGREVHLHGPHDVLRLLAYDLFAAW